MIRRDIFETEMREHARALRQSGIDIPYGPGEPRDASSQVQSSFSRQANIDTQYYIAKDESNRIHLSTLLQSEVEDDPAFQVRTFHYFGARSC